MEYPNTVLTHTVAGHRVVLVGEHHTNEASGKLCERVLAEENPSVVAIESCPERFDVYVGTGYQLSTGALAAEQYVRNESAELVLLDILQSDSMLELDLLPDTTEHLEKEQPEFDESVITDTGGVHSIDYIEQHIEQQKEYSMKRYQFIWETRQEYMKNVLLQKLVTLPHNEPVVVIIGLSHLYQFSELLDTSNPNSVTVDEEFLQERSFRLDPLDLAEQRTS